MSDETTEPTEAESDRGDEDNHAPGPTATAVAEYLTKSLVSDPDAVDVEVDARGNRVRLTVRVGDGDMGRVIGRRGRMANAIRSVVRAAATRDDVQADVEFED